jgi:hypothetical protein
MGGTRYATPPAIPFTRLLLEVIQKFGTLSHLDSMTSEIAVNSDEKLRIFVRNSDLRLPLLSIDHKGTKTRWKLASLSVLVASWLIFDGHS